MDARERLHRLTERLSPSCSGSLLESEPRGQYSSSLVSLRSKRSQARKSYSEDKGQEKILRSGGYLYHRRRESGIFSSL